MKSFPYLLLRAVAISAIISVILLIVFRIPTDDRAIAPRKPIGIYDRMKIDGKPPAPLHGELDLVGVVEFDVSFGEKLWLRFDDTVTFVPKPPPESRKREEQISDLEIARSKEIAAAVAFRMLGRPVEIRGAGAYVGHVDPEGPSVGKLRPADRIVTINGKKVETANELIEAVRAVPVGTALRLGIRRARLPEIVKMRTGDDPRSPGRSRLGIQVSTPQLKIVLPNKVEFDTRHIGGPSAGLAFALAIYDSESVVDLLQGRHVVASGAVTPEGDVVPVGGALQKAVAAQQAGADILLIPAENKDAADKGVREACDEGQTCVEVVPVRSVQEAVELLSEQ